MTFLNSEAVNQFVQADLFLNKLGSIDLPISNQIVNYESDVIEINKEETYNPKLLSFTNLEIKPTETVLILLDVKLQMDIKHVGFIFARYSFTSLGLDIKPIILQPGFSGKVYISVTNLHKDKSIKGIFPGTKLVQMMVASLDQSAHDYSSLASSKYTADSSFLGSRAFSDEEINNIIAKYAVEKNLS